MLCPESCRCTRWSAMPYSPSYLYARWHQPCGGYRHPLIEICSSVQSVSRSRSSSRCLNDSYRNTLNGTRHTGTLEQTVFIYWPTDWSLLPQLVLALLISQFGEYWAHRAMHEIPYLWRFHAIHHSPERLYWLNAARFHPVDTAILLIISMAPLIILGAGPDILILLTVWMSTHGMFQHCNIRVRLGPLNYVFSMAELHRWHHALAPEQSNANYGNNILIWDLIFGTVYYPKDKLPSRHIGLRNGADFPKGYGAQILSPWRSDKQGQEHPP
jgi:sterol desaturase/sphingolipid hydroxylase (fatty acid hydroxylase superfamily)